MHYDRSCACTEWSGDARLCVCTSLALHVDLFCISHDRVQEILHTPVDFDAIDERCT